MSFADVLEAADRRRLTLVHYTPERGDLDERFATRSVGVAHRSLPQFGPQPFVTLYEDGEFRAAVSETTLEWFLAPPRPTEYDADDLSPAYRALVGLLDDTVFTTLSRRQLVATAREIEDRAYRTGRGELHAGFQSLRAFEAQADRYRRLADETDLDVHVYVVPDADAGDLRDSAVTVHQSVHPDVGRYWFVVFDGGGTDQQSALVAEQVDERTYEGAWTYDPGVVATALDAVPA